MIRYLIRRLLLTIPVLLGVTIIVFLFVRLIPGDPATAMVGERASQEALERVRERLGLNRPVYEQYIIFMVGNDVAARLRYEMHQLTGNPIPMPVVREPFKGVLRGDLGKSLFTGRSIISGMASRFPATIELALAGMLFAILIGIPAGIFAAMKRGTAADTASMTVALTGVSVPVYWLGLMGILLFAVVLRWVPTGARLGVDVDLRDITNFHVLDSLITGNVAALGDSLRHLVLPACVMGTVPMAMIARMTRSSMLEVLSQDYVRTARAKGLSERVVILRHALKNALLPVVTVIGLSVGFLFSGAVLTESIFAWPGVGRWVFQAILNRDYTLIQAVTLAIAVIFVFVNLCVDLMYAALDPRIRYH
jgi:ABC-type dipeptide/oligopeptide/nickel transport system permease component